VSAVALFTAVFLACAVEAVEAATIVLAAGTARDWRSAITGMFAALLALVLIVAALGPALSVVPLRGLRLVVGGLLLVFGLQWLRKAILRASGHKALHDEDEIYRVQVAAASAAASRRFGSVPDWYGFTLSFKGVLLEGLEVAFIALTFGSNAGDMPLAAIAAVCALVVVAAAGAAVRGPLARVPENQMKLIVGVMLTAFGTFWGAEGAGASWPGSDAALLVLVPAIAAFALALIALMRRVPAPVTALAPAGAAPPVATPDPDGPDPDGPDPDGPDPDGPDPDGPQPPAAVLARGDTVPTRDGPEPPGSNPVRADRSGL
jgi:uncharacterized membrane protein